jgi:predicted nucleic acid-binding protein
MSIYFADTSAIIKYYVSEVGSKWVESWADSRTDNTIVISRLTTVELVSGLARRQREKAIDSVAFTKLRGAFLNNVDNFYIAINLYKEVLAEARDLTERYPLRAMVFNSPVR